MGTPGLSKPGDAKQAVSDAQARTAHFTDLKYTLANIYTSASGGPPPTTSQVSATTSPVRIRIASPASNGQQFVTTQDGARNIFCTHPFGGPDQQFPSLIAANAADPFAGLGQGLGWRYLADAELGGRRTWHLISDFDRTVRGANPNNIVINLATKEIWIDSATGKILKLMDHNSGTENGVKYDQKLTHTDFVYDTGLSVPGCP